jgi:hypothetical protein
MNSRAEMLKRRIATYRRRIAENPDIDSVRLYLAEIVVDQVELDRIEAAAGGGAKSEGTRD